MRTRGSARFAPYYKVQEYDPRSAVWVDVQKAHPTAGAARAAYRAGSTIWRLLLASTTNSEPRTVCFEPVNSSLQCADTVVATSQTPPGLTGAHTRRGLRADARPRRRDRPASRGRATSSRGSAGPRCAPRGGVVTQRAAPRREVRGGRVPVAAGGRRRPGHDLR